MSIENFTLRGDAQPIELERSGITLIAPGLIGAGTSASADKQTDVRAFTGDTDSVHRAVEDAGLEERHVLKIDAPTPGVRAGAARSGAGIGADEILMQVPLKTDERAFVVYTDEAGQASYHYAGAATRSAALPTRAVGAARQDQFRIALRSGQDRDPGERGHRGLFGKLLTKAIRVIVVKVFPDAGGKIVARCVEAWERKNRAHRGFHGGASASELLGEAPAPCALASLRGQKALLFIHGTTSTTAGAFGKLRGVADVMQRLYRRYENRVVGFNHHTMSVGVRNNVQDFVDALAQVPGDYRFDIVCHSRGGLVARALATLGDPGKGLSVSVDRIVFVATPNSGTDLAIPERVPSFVERLTNYVNMLPDSAPVLALGALMSIAGSLAEVALPRLPGLADQAPDSELLKALALAGQGDGRHAAFRADYTAKGNLAAVVADHAVDQIFGNAKNDLVVPTEGVSKNLRIDPDRVVTFGAADGVHHTNFFAHPRIAGIADFLGA